MVDIGFEYHLLCTASFSDLNIKPAAFNQRNDETNFCNISGSFMHVCTVQYSGPVQ